MPMFTLPPFLLRLATHPDRLLEMKRYLGVAETSGVEAHLLGPEEIGRLHRLANPAEDHVTGGRLGRLDSQHHRQIRF